MDNIQLYTWGDYGRKIPVDIMAISEDDGEALVSSKYPYYAFKVIRRDRFGFVEGHVYQKSIVVKFDSIYRGEVLPGSAIPCGDGVKATIDDLRNSILVRLGGIPVEFHAPIVRSEVGA